MAFVKRTVSPISRLLACARALHSTPPRSADKSYQFVVCGGGAGGLAVGASIARKFGPGKLAVIEPSEVTTALISAVTEQTVWMASGYKIATLGPHQIYCMQTLGLQCNILVLQNPQCLRMQSLHWKTRI